MGGNAFAHPVKGTIAEPEPQGLEAARWSRVRELEFAEKVSTRIADIVEILAACDSHDDAVVRLAELLDADEVEVMVCLSRFDLLTLTRPGELARRRRLALLRDSHQPHDVPFVPRQP